MITADLVQFEQFALREITHLEKRVRTHLEDAVIPYYFQKMQSITFYARQKGQEAIKTAVNNVKSEPGRYETGAFLDGFTLDNGKKTGNKQYEFKIGWLNGKPDWSSYQELGFKHTSGMYVTGADALGEAERYIQSEVAKLK